MAESKEKQLSMSGLKKEVHKMYKSESVYKITGRGIVYLIEMKNYPNETIKLGDQITIDNITGRVTGIEVSQHSTTIGVLIRNDVTT